MSDQRACSLAGRPSCRLNLQEEERGPRCNAVFFLFFTVHQYEYVAKTVVALG